MTKKQIEEYLNKKVIAHLKFENIPLKLKGELIKEKSTYSIITKNPYNSTINTVLVLEGFYAKDFKKIEVLK